ncbi:MAG: (Fe-S)-binding protein [Bacteroidota bacterium]|nr:(Fe-S)-binding protein [Bacteroidota bacterium]
MKISLFIPCLVDQFAPQVGVATVNILKKLGCSIEYPFEQTCCGQPAFNTGYRNDAKILAERFINIFANSEYIVAPSGSCVSMVKVFYDQLDLSEEARNKLEHIKINIFELSEFIVNVLQLTEVGASFKGRVTYHESCHLLRELHISKEPRELIKHVKGVEFIEMKESNRCCGFGGTFSLKFPELSTTITEDKVLNIINSGAEYVVANDTSCLMNIDVVLKRKRSKIKTLHIAELLAISN